MQSLRLNSGNRTATDALARLQADTAAGLTDKHSSPMLVLGVETSCDDTAAAVLQDGRTILANVVSSQDQVHGPYGGVVPELASRQHIKTILPIVDGALQKAGATLKDLDGIAVTYGPGLVGSLLVGLSMVKGDVVSHGHSLRRRQSPRSASPGDSSRA